jgi:branched-chain amino acid transport system permease protein
LSARSGLKRLLPFALFAAGSLLLPFVGGAYALDVGMQFLMWVALTQSWTILSGMAGYISLGHAVFYGLGAYLVVLTWGNIPLWLAFPLAGLANFVFAIAISRPVMRVRGPYFVILTFGLSELVKFVVVLVESSEGQFSRLLFDTPGIGVLYWMMLVFAFAATGLALFVRVTRFGQGLLAIREDEEAAQAIGIPIVRYKTLAYGLSAVIPGMVGGVMALRTNYFEPQQAFDPFISFTIVTIAIVGGSDDARGPLLGAAFFTFLSELLWAKAPQGYLILLGLILIAFVLLLPEGICGWLYAPARSRR